VSVDGDRFADFDSLRDYIIANPGREIDVVVSRDGVERTIPVDLAARNPDGEEVGFLGIRPQYDRIRVDPVAGATRSVRELRSTMWLSLKGLGHVFSPDGISGYVDTLSSAGEPDPDGEEPALGDEERFLSPVGAVRFASQAASTGIIEILGFLVAINVFVGIFNLVPLLPLDGGHVAIATYEKIRSALSGRRYQADVAKLLPLTYGVFVLLILIGVSALYVDLVDPVQNPFE
jgi:membrane-associated protease RseP (regulator of RpoE activity)